MVIKPAVRRTLFAAAMFASMLSIPQLALADDDKAARAAQASDPQYGAAYLSSWSALHKMKPMEAMHAIDADQKGYVTREEFMKFQEQLFARMDRNHDGKISTEEWMGSSASNHAAEAKTGKARVGGNMYKDDQDASRAAADASSR